MKKIFFFFIIFCSTYYSQLEDTTQTTFELDNLLEESTEDKEDSQIYDSIEYLLNNPIVLNDASIRDLMKIPTMNLQIATAIIRYRNLQGGIYTDEQLLNIPNIDIELIKGILPFLTLGDKSTKSFWESLATGLGKIKFSYRFRTQQDIQTRMGFTNGKFLGSKSKYYQRAKLYSDHNYDIGLLFEKDSGEKSINDFSSFYFRFRDLSLVKNLVIGDYVFEFGQGLAIWSPYSFSKGTEATGLTNKIAGNVIPYSSADENNFLRGFAFNVPIRSFIITPFFSSNMIDASIDTSSNYISVLVKDGYHRTENEESKKNKVAEKVFGTSLDYIMNENTKISFLYFRNEFDKLFVNYSSTRSSSSLYEYSSFSYSTLINKLFLSGEISYNSSSIALITNAELLISKDFTLSFSFRNFPRNFISLRGNSFGEKGIAQNEVGFYTGIKLNTSIGLLNIYYDQFKYPIAANNYNFSSIGNDFLVYFTKRISTNAELKLKYKIEIKDYVDTKNIVAKIEKQSLQNLRADLNYKVNKSFQLRSRIELVYYSDKYISNEKGFLIFQDVKYSPLSKLNFTARIILFSTDSYNSRVYQFENDLLGVMTNPALNGEGFRWYVIAKYNIGSGLNISLKYSEMSKPNERFLGSGDSQIENNIDNRLSFQFDFSF